MVTDKVAQLDDERIGELRAQHLARLNWQDFLEFSEPEKVAPEAVSAMTDYFRRFVAVAEGCVNCGAKQGGDMIEQALGLSKFTWGLAHGEGFCSGGGYPGRAYHYDIGPIKRLNAILQYHPDELMTKAEREALGVQ